MTLDRMSPGEFRRLGYLQELNRRFLHPLGLALEVVVEEDGTERFGEVWDFRSDPEGIIFDDMDEDFINKAMRIQEALGEKIAYRRKHLGYSIQPLPVEDDEGK